MRQQFSEQFLVVISFWVALEAITNPLEWICVCVLVSSSVLETMIWKRPCSRLSNQALCTQRIGNDSFSLLYRATSKVGAYTSVAVTFQRGRSTIAGFPEAECRIHDLLTAPARLTGRIYSEIHHRFAAVTKKNQKHPDGIQ